MLHSSSSSSLPTSAPQLAFAWDTGAMEEEEEGEDQTASEAGDAVHWDGLVLAAVPKRRNSHQRRRLRMQNKWLKPLKNIAQCADCGSPKLMHHLCPQCAKLTEKTTRAYRTGVAAAGNDVGDADVETTDSTTRA
jgi:large subunit ribosomal protein L32